MVLPQSAPAPGAHLPPVASVFGLLNSHGGMWPRPLSPSTGQNSLKSRLSLLLGVEEAHLALMSALSRVEAAPAEPRKKCHSVPGTEGTFFYSSSISTSIYFYFIYFSRREALFQHRTKVGTGGKAKSLLYPSVAILVVGGDSNCSPHPDRCIPPHLFTTLFTPHQF